MIGAIFIELSVVLLITIVLAFVGKLLRQPLIIAYILAGMIAGPMVFNVLRGETGSYELFAQVGIVLLLFVIGLNLNFRKLKSIGAVSAITGVGQVVFTAGFGVALLLWLKFSIVSSIYLAVAITFSSTIIIMKFLADKKATETTYGRYTIGLMLVQDIIALGIMIVIGLMRNNTLGLLPISFLVIKGVVAVGVIMLLAKYVLPKMTAYIADSAEFLFLFTLTWCFGIASMLYALGFSLEIGAIVAGIALSSSPYQLEIGSRIKPLRDFFLVLFFIVLGSGLHLGDIASYWRVGLILTVFVIVGNSFILYALFRALKFTRRNSFLSGITAAQVSEFGFVILFTGQQAGHITGLEIPVFTFVAIATIFVSSYLILHNEFLYSKLLPLFKMFGPDKIRQSERKKTHANVWVVGYHRIGKRVAHALSAKKIAYSVIDYDPLTIEELRKEKVPAVFGDISDIELLTEIPLAEASLIVMTIPSTADQMSLMAHVRAINEDVLIVANAYYEHDAEVLYGAGSDFVMMPHVVGGNWIADVLKKKVTHKSLATLRAEQGILHV